MLLTKEVRTRLDKVIAAGYMTKHGDSYATCSLTDKGMAVLLAEADSPLQVGDLVKPSLMWERFWTDSNRNGNRALE